MDVALQVAVPVASTLLLGTLLGVFLGRKREQHRWLEENIYRPAFNEVSSVVDSDGSKLNGDSTSVIEGLDSFSRARLRDKKLGMALDAYCEALQEFRPLASAEFRERVSPDPGLMKAVSDAVPEGLRTTNSPAENTGLLFYRRGSSTSSTELDRWLFLYWEILHSGGSGKELAEAIAEASRDLGMHEYVSKWPQLYPEFFDALADIFRPRTQLHLFRQRAQSRSQVVDQATRVKLILRKRVR